MSKEMWYPDAHGASPRMFGHAKKSLGVFAMILVPSASGKSHYARAHHDVLDGDTIVERVLGWPTSAEFTNVDHYANWSAMAAVARFSGKPVLWNGMPFLSPALLLYAVIPPFAEWRVNADRRIAQGRPDAWGTADEHYHSDVAAIERLIEGRSVRAVFRSIGDAVGEAIAELAAQGVDHG